ncbi:class I SAM-dependent methyltransferase [Sporosarcina sp. G11-34]|uniref:class I SAM-dependent methyltransferase n=1 Tax=Sporosarcina sp. G11-34 TaxID=2849605 RepID=UPI0022A9C6EE|nr:class I SAM-dependent methyltransferase [Sporosarcina sp. G11-34]
MTTIITTGGRPDDLSRELAKEASEVLGYPIIERNKRSVTRIQDAYEANCLISGKERFELYRIGMDKPFFFHPNSAAFRLKRLVSGETDPLMATAQLQAGMTFLDCTLGLASDSIIASFVTGESGKVTGVEMDPDVAFITERGLRSFPSNSEELTDAMGRINVIHSDAVAFLETQNDASWDIVYIDPMFSAPIDESANFTPLRQVGASSLLTEEWLKHARRVCKHRVVVKDRFDSPVFEHFGFKRIVRPNTKFHFGFIEK